MTGWTSAVSAGRPGRARAADGGAGRTGRRGRAGLRTAPVALRRSIACTVLGALLVAVSVVALGSGPVALSPSRVLEIIGHGLGWGSAEVTSAESAVIWHVRMPRIVIAALVGAALATSGVVMQGVFRNPLAEPGVIGVSAGASVGAVTALYFGLTAISRWLLPGLAFLGAMIAVTLVFAVSQLARRQVTATLLLVGIAVNAFLGSIISIMLATATTEEDLRSITFWLQGGLDARTWDHVGLVLVPILAVCGLLMVFGRDLNVMVLGDDQGRATGVDVARSRIVMMVLAACVTGIAVSVTGTISFVGMVVPHALRPGRPRVGDGPRVLGSRQPGVSRAGASKAGWAGSRRCR